ncbi:MAG: cell division protein FtsA [Ignavibacteriales bacterium]|nr:cell division protein FtsA [Ignavibacteriales bacterium]
MSDRYVCGVDLGTTKVCAAIAERDEDGVQRILGFGVAPSAGFLHKGMVANISKTAEAISAAVALASNRAGVDVRVINVGVAGEHISSMRHRNYVTIADPDREISQEDIDRLKADLKTFPISPDRQILHIIPEEFFIDHQGGVQNPVGMAGSRLEAVNHLVLASIAAIQNIWKSVERAGFEVGEYILQPIASSVATLDDNEMDIGTLLIDIGGGTTDIAILHNHTVRYTEVIGVAGNQVTNDIREALGVVTEEAEALKKRYGYATERAIVKDEEILIHGVGARKNSRIPVSLLTQIISLRMRELFTMIDGKVRKAGLKDKIKAGVVLTGGGSLLRGCADLVEEVLGLPAKIGVPLESATGSLREIERPEYSTSVGLLTGLPAAKAPEEEQKKSAVFKPRKKRAKKGMLNQAWTSFKDFFDEL